MEIKNELAAKAAKLLDRLCNQLPNRQVGRPGNRMATNFFAEIASSFGFTIEAPEFDCIDWTEDGASLSVGAARFNAQPSPYSLGCWVDAPLVVVSSLDELEIVQAMGKVLLIRDELAREQIMPKNFPFYNPDHHKKIVRLLEQKRPAAIVTATARNPELAGGVYPFPMIEDGDFDIPSVYITEIEGNRLARYADEIVSLKSITKRVSARGCNVIARKGSPLRLTGGAEGSGGVRRVVFMAHIDAKYNTPGALDNGAGVTTLLLLAELLADYEGELAVEIMAINGEDYYAASGQKLFLQQNTNRLSEIMLGVNLDAPGYIQGCTAYSIYDCPLEISRSVRTALSAAPGMIEGERWYQGDHSMLIQNGVPAVAITSERFIELSTHFTHTPKDRTELVDAGKLASIAATLQTLLLSLNLNAHTI